MLNEVSIQSLHIRYHFIGNTKYAEIIGAPFAIYTNI